MGNAAAKRDAIALAVIRGDASDLASMLDQLSPDDRHNGKYYDEGDEDGRTPLHHASSNGFVVAVELLLRTGANKNELDNNGRTPLFLAVANEHVDVVELLTHMRVDLDHSFTATSQLDGEVSHEPPLHHAADHGLLGMVQMLVRAGADPNKRFSDVVGKTYSGCTPLHRAAHNGHTDVVQALIDAGGGVDNVESRGGNTPVHLAASRGHLAVCKVLVESGQADLDRRNNKNNTALDKARNGDFKEIEEYFEQALQTRLALDPHHRQSMSLKAAMAKKDTAAAAAKARRDNANEAALLNAPSPSPSETKLFGAFRHVTQSMSKMVNGYRMGGHGGVGDGSYSSDYDLSSIIESVGHSSSVFQSVDDCDIESEPLATDRSHLGGPLTERKLSVSNSGRGGTKQQDTAVASAGELKLPALFTPTTPLLSRRSSFVTSSSAANSGHSSSTVSSHASVAGNTTPTTSAGGGDGFQSTAAMRGGMGLMPSMLQTASILALSMRGNRFCAEDDGEESDNDGHPTDEGNNIEQLRHLLEQHNIGRHASQGDETPYKDRTGLDDEECDSSDNDSDDDVHDVFASCYERQQRENTPARTPARTPVRSNAPSGFQSLSSSYKQPPTTALESASPVSSPMAGTSPTQRPSSASAKVSLPYLMAGMGLRSSSKVPNAAKTAAKATNTPRSGAITPSIMPRLTTATATMTSTSTMETLSAAASALSSPSPRTPRR